MILPLRNLLFHGALGAPAMALLVSADKRCDETYDFIVVGSGAGGGVVASRLAEAGFDTLVLDAGPDYNELDTQTPIFWPTTTVNPFLEWAFRVKNTEDQGQDNVLYPRSSNIGGCTMHNAMQAAYPYPKTFNELKDLTDDDEWDEIKMRQRFINIEKNEYSIPQNPTTGHGDNGFASISFSDPRLLSTVPESDFFDPQLLTLLGLLNETYPSPTTDPVTGLNVIPDINAPGLNMFEGLHFCPTSISPENGYKRSSVYYRLKEAAEETGKLTIKGLSFVTKVLLEEEDEDGEDEDDQGEDEGSKPTAYGVKVQGGAALYSASTGTRQEGVEKVYCANKEVIVAGGAFNTPQILMLSGIGPRDHLEDHGIEVKADVPGVGKNLQDKLEASSNFLMNNNWKVFEQGCTFGQPTPQGDPCLYDYITGIFPNLYTSSGVFFSVQKKSHESLDAPDMYVQISPSKFERYKDGWVEESLSVQNVLTLNAATAVSSTGDVTLESSDPFDQVNIDFKGYDDADLTRMASFVQELRNVINFGLGNFGFVQEELRPGPSITSQEELKDWVRKNGWGHHACCTAKIGHEYDEDAVLDGQLRVRKVKNLRVVDASSFPAMPGFFPTIPIMMLAEKAAEDIISEWTEESDSDE